MIGGFIRSAMPAASRDNKMVRVRYIDMSFVWYLSSSFIVSSPASVGLSVRFRRDWRINSSTGEIEMLMPLAAIEAREAVDAL